MTNQAPMNGWTSPATFTRVLRDIGAPIAIVIFLLGVLTGLIKTPLMKSLDLIPELKADGESAARILQDIRYLNQVECMRTALTAADRKECSLPAQ